MKFYGRVTRRVSVASTAVLTGAILLGLVPWKLVAAESEDTKEPLIQRIAALKVSQYREGRLEGVVCAPMIVFTPGHDAAVAIGNEEEGVEITIRTVPDEQPMQHLVEVTFRDNKTKKPVVLTASKIILDGKQGKIICEGPPKLEIEASVKPLK